MRYPCIRNLDPFRKKGCPQKSWKGNEGCPCWIQETVPTKGGQKENIGQCIDLWMFKMTWDQCGLLEGNQQATESFRNGMIQTDEKGQTHPKSDPAIVVLLGLLKNLQNKQEIIIQHEIQKAIGSKN